MLYRVRQGLTFGHSDQHTAGTVLDLAPHEAAPFLDKLEPVAGEPSLDTVSSEASGDGTGQPRPRDRRRRTGEANA